MSSKAESLALHITSALCKPLAIRRWALTAGSLLAAPCLEASVLAPGVQVAVLLMLARVPNGWGWHRCRRRKNWCWSRRPWSRGRCRSRQGLRSRRWTGRWLRIDVRPDEIHGVEHTSINSASATMQFAPGGGPIQCPPPACLSHKRAATVATTGCLTAWTQDTDVALRCCGAAATNDVYLCLLQDLRHWHARGCRSPAGDPEVSLAD